MYIDYQKGHRVSWNVLGTIRVLVSLPKLLHVLHLLLHELELLFHSITTSVFFLFFW
uniref:Uncharacterized protein MANES_01G182900 n=1 Tax=Rhizophora mucronata TaxID=61149 RepID=A0A2P2M318_RHIMU